MATATKIGKKWRCKVSWYEIDPQDTSKKIRKYKYLFGFDTKRAALKEGNKYEVLKNEHRISAKDPVFAEYFLKWAETYKMPGKTPGTQQRYLLIHKRLLAFFGATKLSKIKKINYQSFINKLGQKFSKDTMQKINGSIRSCVTDAINEGFIQHNFTSHINLLYNDAKTRKVEYLSAKEMKTVVQELSASLNTNYTSKYMILTALYTGARIGEIMALTWQDIDFEHNLISISKSYDYVNDRIKAPKTDSSIRTIKITAQLASWLQELIPNKQNYIFANKNTGQVPTSAGVNKVLRSTLKKCDISKTNFHFHSLRHTHVAFLLYNHIDLFYISKRLGHANMTITAKVYAYLIDEMKAHFDQATVDALDHITN